MSMPTEILLRDSTTNMTMPLLLVFVALFMLSAWFFSLIISRSNHRHYKFPPSPSRLPVIGNFHQVGLFPHRGMASLAQRHGSLMLLKLGSAPTLIVSSAKSAAEVFKTHDVIFSNRPVMRVWKTYFYGQKDLATARYGEHWRKMRSLVTIHVLTAKRVREYNTIREEEVSLMMENIQRTCGKPFVLGELLASVTNDITCRVSFGRKYSEGGGGHNAVNFKKLLQEMVYLFGAFNVGRIIPWLSWLNNFNGFNLRVKRLSQELDSVFQSILDDHVRKIAQKQEEVTVQKDLVDVMLEFQGDKKNGGGGTGLTDVNIKGVIMDMFVAGTETTLGSLEWTVSELVKNPEVMRRAQREVREIVGTRDRVTEEDITQMKYLKAVIKETFRLHPPLPFLLPRETTHDVNVQGYDIPAKTRVLVNAWAIGRDPNSWERPHEFDPERFLKGDSTSARDFRGHHFELIPFGAGRRGCPGISFAIYVIELVLANLLLKFDLSLPEGCGKLEDLDMSEVFGVTVRRKYPLVVVATAAARASVHDKTQVSN